MVRGRPKPWRTILELAGENLSFKKMKCDFNSPNRIPGKSKLERCRGSITAFATAVHLMSPRQPPTAAEFSSTARQRWQRIVWDGKPRRGDIQSNRRSLLTLPPPWFGHADDCIYCDASRFLAVSRAAPPAFCPQAVSWSSP